MRPAYSGFCTAFRMSEGLVVASCGRKVCRPWKSPVSATTVVNCRNRSSAVTGDVPVTSLSARDPAGARLPLFAILPILPEIDSLCGHGKEAPLQPQMPVRVSYTGLAWMEDTCGKEWPLAARRSSGGQTADKHPKIAPSGSSEQILAAVTPRTGRMTAQPPGVHGSAMGRQVSPCPASRSVTRLPAGLVQRILHADRSPNHALFRRRL